ncbi:hypothetical protein H9P43_003857 [Blastocladiella emersonii ATCC 22665]|nr:hypothetical protein H9P43_003857 [Blastocladiella emersonii ATCC 22665]
MKSAAKPASPQAAARLSNGNPGGSQQPNAAKKKKAAASPGTASNDAKSKVKICPMYSRTGWCKFGKGCKFSHDVVVSKASSSAKAAKRVPSNGKAKAKESASSLKNMNDLAKAVRSVMDSPTAADEPHKLYVVPRPVAATSLVADPAIRRPATSTSIDMPSAAKVLAEILRQLESNPPAFLLALKEKCPALTALRDLAQYAKYSATLGNPSFQTVLLPLLYILSHPSLETSTLDGKVALVRDAVADSTSNLIRQFLDCTRAALVTRSLVDPLALAKVKSGPKKVQPTFQPLSFAQALAPMLKYLAQLAARDSTQAGLDRVRHALVEIEMLVNVWQPLVGVKGDDAFAAVETPRAVQLVRELLAKAKRPLCDAVPLATQVKAQLNFNKKQAAAFAAAAASAPPVAGARPNDHADHRLISIVPTMAEIQSDVPPTLPGNFQFDTTKHWLAPGPQRLLDTPFRLYRNDMMSIIGGSVRLFVDFLNRGGSVQRSGRFERKDGPLSADLMVYTKIELGSFAVDKHAGILLNVGFERPKSIPFNDFKNGCLQWGNLVCVFYPESPTGSYTAEFMLIADRDKVHKNTVGLSFLNYDGATPRHPLLRSGRSHAYPTRAARPIYLAEFRGFLFEAYRPVLKALQDASPWTIPLANVVCPPAPPMASDKATQVPRYARGNGFAFDLSFLTINPGSASIKFTPTSSASLKNTMALLAKHSELDPSQASALLQALSTDVSCIQGAPGCGKSRVGVSIARAIIKAVESGQTDKGFSILIMCHTNHALDQFLLGLVKAGFKNLVRIGGRCGEELEAFRPNVRKGGVGLGGQFKAVYTALEKNAASVAAALERSRRDDMSMLRAALQSLLPQLWTSIRSRQYRGGDSLSVWLHGRDLGPHGMQHVVPFSQRASHLRQAPKFDASDLNDQLIEFAGRAVRSAAQQGEGNGATTASPAAAAATTTTTTTGSSTAARDLDVLLRCTDAWSVTKRERGIIADHLLFDAEFDAPRDSNLESQLANCVANFAELKQLRQQREVNAIRGYTVIGMTTTGAAARQHLLRGLSPAVIICEEAGEILEAHTLAAMHPNLQHLILIGDHKQLRPKINNYELSVQSHVGREYRLDISMFERLIVPERDDLVPTLGHAQLRHQRRMKPLISQFIRRGGIYPELMDGANTLGRPPVRGMTKDVYLMTHDQPQLAASSGLSSGSHSNQFEAEMTVALVDHLLRQGYTENQIVVITPYIGQLSLINKTMDKWRLKAVVDERDAQQLVGRRTSDEGDEGDENDGDAAARAAPSKFAKATIRVATVDAYQGEEADIIVISLVRSSLANGSDRGIGFLSVANRVNVMLSRAKLGMYLVGNAALLEAKSDLWATLFGVMREQDLIGPAFEIGCQNHPETRHLIDDPAGFRQHAPEGGCTIPCEATLKCGHNCRRLCHGDDRDHAAAVCRVPVARVALPGCGHAYAPVCFELAQLDSIECATIVEHTRSCGHSILLPCHRVASGNVPKCTVRVDRTRQCGHAVTVLYFKDADEDSCRVKMDAVAHPRCGHTIEPKCFQLADLAGVACTVAVKKERSCGHSLSAACHQDADQIPCTWTCSAMLACSHACSLGSSKASETDCDRHRRDAPSASSTASPTASSSCPPCTKPAMPSCDHARPSGKCGEPSAPCMARCLWTACSHGASACDMPCGAPCTRLPCDSRCEKLLSCGHRCPSICGEKCPDSAFCRECASAKIRAQPVDPAGGDVQYDALDLDARPIVVLKCRHVVPVDLLDAHVGLAKYYARGGAKWSSIRPATRIEQYDEVQLNKLAALFDSIGDPQLAGNPKAKPASSLALKLDELTKLDSAIAGFEQLPARRLHLEAVRDFAVRNKRNEPADLWFSCEYEMQYATAILKRGTICASLFALAGVEDPVSAEFYFDDACDAFVRAGKRASTFLMKSVVHDSTAAWIELFVDYIGFHNRMLKGGKGAASSAQLSRRELSSMLVSASEHLAGFSCEKELQTQHLESTQRIHARIVQLRREVGL